MLTRLILHVVDALVTVFVAAVRTVERVTRPYAHADALARELAAERALVAELRAVIALTPYAHHPPPVLVPVPVPVPPWRPVVVPLQRGKDIRR